MLRLLTILLLLMSTISYAQLPEEPEKYFDFWVGDWEATWDEGDGKIGKGTNRIEKILDGMVIQENFEVIEGKAKGFKGTSISTYQAPLETWKQSWADNQSTFYYFKGSVDGENRIFQTEVFDMPDGSRLTQRMVFKEIEEDSMTWDWEASKDGGDSWTLNWRIQYKRKT